MVFGLIFVSFSQPLLSFFFYRRVETAFQARMNVAVYAIVMYASSELAYRFFSACANKVFFLCIIALPKLEGGFLMLDAIFTLWVRKFYFVCAAGVLACCVHYVASKYASIVAFASSHPKQTKAE